jgi:predicted CopG family antitoxin
MGTKQIRVSEGLYARVKSEKREDETMGEALERMVGGYSLVDFAENTNSRNALDMEQLEEDIEEISERNKAEIREQMNLE